LTFERPGVSVVPTREELATMYKAVISVLGRDRPGIVAAVSRTLFEHTYNIEEVSQTILQGEFAGIFIVSHASESPPADLHRKLAQVLSPMGLEVLMKPLENVEGTAPKETPSEPFVVTTIGSDRLGLVAGITEVMASFGVNITNLKAVFRGGDDPRRNVMIYEVDIPLEIEREAFHQALRDRADSLGLDLSFQHRDIFEAIHRI
jgi:glycine cleavage system transcriptional repressor